MCQYLFWGRHCPWDASACTEAIEGRSVATLRWLHENGCPWSTEAVNMAAAALKTGGVEIIEYLWAEGAVPDAAVLTKMLCKVCALDNFTTAQWLRQHDAQWPAAITTGTCSTWCSALHLCVHYSACCVNLSMPVQGVVLLLCLSAAERGDCIASLIS
jgi:hypothetical protein